jgi:hypothetical protein
LAKAAMAKQLCYPDIPLIRHPPIAERFAIGYQRLNPNLTTKQGAEGNYTLDQIFIQETITLE